MPDQPSLRTTRLVLRPFVPSDAPSVQRLAGALEVADTTLHIPHPYPDGAADAWIGTHPKRYSDGDSAIFAVLEGQTNRLVGAIGLELAADDASAELGYWIGKPYWNRGYCTEAAGAIIRFGFEQLNLNRIQARHFSRNPASGRVMQKVGMAHEGHLRQAVRKWGKFEELELYAILKGDNTP